jgi:hypothetical protein
MILWKRKHKRKVQQMKKLIHKFDINTDELELQPAVYTMLAKILIGITHFKYKTNEKTITALLILFATASDKCANNKFCYH